MSYVVDTIELRKAMAESGYTTIGKLAEESRVDRNTIGGILSGKIRPSSNIIEKVSHTLNLDGEDVGRIFFKNELA